MSRAPRLGIRSLSPTQLLLMDVNASQAGHAPDDIAGFYAELRRQLAQVPGVSGATLSHASLIRAARSLAISAGAAPRHTTRVLMVGPDFFATMGVPLVQGRAGDERDVAGRPMVAVVSELYAATFFGGASAVGRRLTWEVPVTPGLPLDRGSRKIDIEIVGVAAAARYGALRDRTPPVVYLPYAPSTFPPITQMTFVFRTVNDPLSIVPAVRRVVQRAEPALPMTNVRTQAVEIDRTISCRCSCSKWNPTTP